MNQGKTLPAHWEMTRLGQVADLVSGAGFPLEHQNKTGLKYPFFKVGNLADVADSGALVEAVHTIDDETACALRAKIIPSNSIVFAKIGMAIRLNRRRLTGVAACIDNNMMAAIPKSGINPRYLLRFLQTVDFMPLSQATTVPSIRRGDLERLAVPLAPTPEQGAVVDEIEKQLSRLDAGVDALKRAQANLKRYRAAILKAACEGKLVPTEVELAQREGRTYEPASVLLNRILEERRKKWVELHGPKKKCIEPERLDAQNLGRLPDGWCWTSLGQLSYFITSGSRGWSQYYSDSGAIFFRSQNLSQVGIDLTDLAYVMPPKNAEGERTRLKIGDLLVSITGNPGNVGQFKMAGNAYISQHVGLVRLVDAGISDFLEVSLRSWMPQRYFERVQYGLTKPGLNLDQLANCPIALAPVAEQQRVCDQIEKEMSAVVATSGVVQSSVQRSRQLKAGILTSAFSGSLLASGLGASVARERRRQHG